LGKHDSECGKRGATYAGNGKKLREANKIGGTSNNPVFFHKLDMYIVEVAGGLEWTVAETEKGAVGISVTAPFHEPTGRLWINIR
jgi:hypothetical protein